MAKAEAGTVIEEFDPPFDWAADEASDTLIVMLPGFKKEQLRVHLTSTGMLKISGEREIEDNKRRRFSKEHVIPEHRDINRISAKFENGLLYVKLPKLTSKPSVPQQEPPAMPQPSLPPPITPLPPPPATMPKADQEQPPAMPQPSQPPPPAQIPKADQEKPSQEVMPPKTNEVTQKPPQREKEQESKPKGKDESMDESAKKLDKEKEKTGTSGIGKKKAKVETKSGKKKAKVETKSPSQVLPASPSMAYREAFVGFVEGLKKKKKVVNLVLAILFVLVLVLYMLKMQSSQVLEDPTSKSFD